MSTPTEAPRSPTNHPNQRATDKGAKKWFFDTVDFRDFIVFLAIAITLVGVYRAERAVRDSGRAVKSAKEALIQTNEGRRVALAANCAALSGVINAGVRTITSSSSPRPDRFARNLEKLGLPPLDARVAAADLAATAYATNISNEVEKSAGVKGLITINRAPPSASQPSRILSITFDCDKLRRASFIPPPPVKSP